MMYDKLFKSMPAFTILSEIIAKTDRMFEKTTGISLAIEKSTSFIRGAENATKYAMGVIPLLDSAAWLRNDVIGYPNLASGAMVYNGLADFPKLPTIPQWILDLNNPTHSALKGVFTAHSNWEKIMPAIPENSTMKNAMDIISGLKGLNAASRSIADISKISESIWRFDASVNHLYKFINDIDKVDFDFQIDIDSQLTVALTYDIDNANSEENKIAITYVTQYFLDTFSTMCENYKSGKDKELFVKWITDFLDDLKVSGVRVTVIKLLVVVIPLFYSIRGMLKDDKVSEATYIAEPAFETKTTTIKFLKESPDNRYKIKFTIPIGTKLTILQDKGKWINVKFISDGVFYSGWTLNSNL